MKKSYLIIGFIAIFLIVYFALPNFYKVTLPDDAKLYDGIARAIVDGKSNIETPNYYANGEDIGNTLMPGYSFFLAIVYLFFGKQNFYAVIAMQTSLSLLAIYVYLLIVKKNLPLSLAIIATGLYSLYLNQWAYNVFVLIESISIVLLIFSLYYLDKYLREFNRKDILFWGLFYGLLIACNNRFIFHLGFIGLYFIYILYKERKALFRDVAFGLLLVIAVLTPWHIRQAIHYKKFVVFAPLREKVSQGETVKEQMVTVFGYVPSYDTVVDLYLSQYLVKDFRKEKREDFTQKFTIDKYNNLKESYIGFGKKDAIISRAKGFFEVYRSDYRFGFAGDMRIEAPSFYDKGILWAFDLFDLVLLGGAFLLSLISIVNNLIKRNHFGNILTFIIISHCILHSLINYLPRYRITVIPAIFLLATLAVKYHFDYWGKRSAKNLK